MAIKINQGSAPVLGRITMPKGTFLSDPLPPLSQPSTAADGALGTGGAMLPPTPQLGGVPGSVEGGRGQLVPWGNNRPAPFASGGNPFLQGGQGAAQWNAATDPNRSLWADLRDWFRGEGKYGQNPDPLLRSIINPAAPTTGTLSAPTNSLVGNDIGSSPTGLAPEQVKRLFPNMTDSQIAQQMAAKGYTYTYTGGRGGIWVKTGEGTGEVVNSTPASAPVDARGRPEWVDPTSLQRNERVTTSNGLTYVGGTPTASGQAQYAVTYPGGVSDERYKWSSQTRQDSDGNWVKIYKREKRAQYTKQWRKKQQARAEEEVRNAPAPTAQPEYVQPSVTVSPPVEYTQLVNLRADYG